MATKDKLQDKTMEDLREMAAKKNVEGRSGMNKEELIDALSSEHPETTGSEAKTEGKKGTPPTEHEGIQIVGTPVTEGKGQTRLFQTGPPGPLKKEWLTKEQAQEKGFYWAD